MKKIWMTLAAGSTLVASSAMSQEWYETMKVKGDVRYRYENIDDETKEDERQRDRIRVRLGVFAKGGSDLDMGAQMTTSEKNDRVSGNSSLTGGGSKKDVYLDLGYLDYHPEALKGLNLIGGKMNNPYIAVADNVWDGDYNPEGLAAKYKAGDEVELLLNAGYHWLTERETDEDDAKQLGAQAAIRFNGEDDFYTLAGVSYFGTENLEGYSLFDDKNYGNTTVKEVDSDGKTNSLFATEYGVLEGFAEIGANVGLPLRGYGSYTVNQDADDEDTGYLVGVSLGKAKDPSSFEVGYNFRSLEKDTVLGALTDSDSGGGGTNHEGHKLFLKYQITKALQAGVTYFMDAKDPDGKDTDYDRLQVDLVGKF